MNSFEQHVLETIDKYNMIKEGQTVIAAVSGGYDSLCMLHVLYNVRRLRRFEICVAHLNHKFRDEADADEAFVADEAKRLGLEFFSRRVNVAEYAEKNGISFETAGRNLRYSFFAELAGKFDNPLIATAHNANDSVESMLMHLMRGSGLSGLTGIKPVNGNVIRPLVETERKEIEKYCDSLGLVPRHDHTNDSDDYRRNDVRHNILAPILERCSIQSLSRTMNILSADDDFMENLARDFVEKHVKVSDETKRIPLKEFNKLHSAVRRRVVRIALGECGGEKPIGLVHVDEVVKIAEKNYGGKVIQLPDGRMAKIEKGELII